VQVEAFEAQLQLAEELRRPVSIHCVRAYGAVHDTLRALRLRVPIVLHSWTGSADMTVALLQLPGVHVSLSGHLLRVPPHKALPMVRAVPLDRLLLESDSPDGALDLSPAWLEALPSLAALPQQLQAAGLHQVNRPAALRFTLQVVAAALGRSEAEVAAATRDNARRIFCSIGSSS
jgi:TatD DNase family protein